MVQNINLEIPITYIVTNKKLTLVAAMGVTIGIAIFIFMNSMMMGFDRKSNEGIFKNSPHIRVYKDEETSKPLLIAENKSLPVIINPKVVPENNRIINPNLIMDMMRKQKEVTYVSAQVGLNVFYNNGKSQINGNTVGVLIDEADRMFNIKSLMVEGNMDDLKSTQNGILLGVGIANKMNVRTSDNISITSSKGINKIMKVVGLFETNNSMVDKSKSYININVAQQLLLQGPSYVTDINVNIDNFNAAPKYSEQLTELTGYKAEDWQAANETLVANSKMRRIIITAVSFSILLVAGFGIYNILNMTISQKINDIAILKAMGFKGRDVIRIFVAQAMIIGFIGIVLGILLALLLVKILAKTYVGGDIGYFPIKYEPMMFLRGILFGAFVTFFAGYFPARNAANVDPVSIFRR